MKKTFAMFIIGLFCFVNAAQLYAHCQVPCGIYDDGMRFTKLREDAATIEKSMAEIQKLEAEQKTNYNQLVRWINNKDKHADYIIDAAANYFLAQRIKLKSVDKGAETYSQQLELLHKIIVYAMKTKQSLDAENLRELKNNIDLFEKSYNTKQ